jgi:hypothetical protein
MEVLQLEKRNAILDEQYDFVISIRSAQNPQVTGQHGRDALAVAERITQQIAEKVRQASRSRLPAGQWQLTGDDSAARHRKAG